MYERESRSEVCVAEGMEMEDWVSVDIWIVDIVPTGKSVCAFETGEYVGDVRTNDAARSVI